MSTQNNPDQNSFVEKIIGAIKIGYHFATIVLAAAAVVLAYYANQINDRMEKMEIQNASIQAEMASFAANQNNPAVDLMFNKNNQLVIKMDSNFFRILHVTVIKKEFVDIYNNDTLVFSKRIVTGEGSADTLNSTISKKSYSTTIATISINDLYQFSPNKAYSTTGSKITATSFNADYYIDVAYENSNGVTFNTYFYYKPLKSKAIQDYTVQKIISVDDFILNTENSKDINQLLAGPLFNDFRLK